MSDTPQAVVQPDETDDWGDDEDGGIGFCNGDAIELADSQLRRGAIPDALIWIERAFADAYPRFLDDLADKVATYYGART